MPPPAAAPVEVQLAEIRGELSTIAARLEAGDSNSEHLFALLKEQLAYFREGMDEIKRQLPTISKQCEATATAVRVDLERQLGRFQSDLDVHVHHKNPHTEQEQWLRAADRTTDERLEALEKEFNERRGANRVITVIISTVISLIVVLVAAAVNGNLG